MFIRRPFWTSAILFALCFAVLIALPLGSSRAAAQCAPPECYPEYPPVSTEEAPTGGGGSWSGYGDGRLNPDMAEFYSVWCANDLIEVWGGAPTPYLVETIPVNQVVNLGDVGSFTTPAGLTVSRTGDTVVISGGNGHSGGTGSKWFSLAACIAANGGPGPADGTTSSGQSGVQPPVETEEAPLPTGEEQIESVSALCIPGTTDISEFLRCALFFAGDDSPFDFWMYLVSMIFTYCAGGLLPIGLVAALPAAHVWRMRRRAIQKDKS